MYIQLFDELNGCAQQKMDAPPANCSLEECAMLDEAPDNPNAIWPKLFNAGGFYPDRYCTRLITDDSGNPLRFEFVIDTFREREATPIPYSSANQVTVGIIGVFASLLAWAFFH